MSQTPPTFPFSASTIIATRPNTVVLKSDGFHEEALSSDSSSIYPGMLLGPLQSDGSVKRHAVFGGRALSRFAKEDAMQGHWFQDPLASGDLVSYVTTKPGDHILALVNASAAAITEGAELVSAGDGTLCLNPGNNGSILYDNAADSTAINTTATETAFSKTFTIPANFLQVGDIIKIKALVAAIGVTSTPTLRTKITLVSGANSPVTTTLLDTSTVAVIANDLVMVEMTLIVRTIGASGTIVGEGSFLAGTPGTAVKTEVALASTALDTTNTEVVTITGKWSASSASNTCLLRMLTVELGRTMIPVAQALEAVDNSANSSTMAYIRVQTY